MVSVLLLSWNHEKFIEQSLYSIIGQTYKDIEIIYLDNNSADNTFTLAESILKQSGVKYKVYKNEQSFGISRNFNFLFSKAQGEYVCLFSGDDWLDKRNIEEKIKPFFNDPYLGMVHSTGYIYYQEIDVYERIEPVFVKKEEVVNELLKKNFISGVGCIIKSEAIKKVGGWDESLLIDDCDMWIKIAGKYDIKLVDIPLFYYRYHANSASKDPEFMYRGKIELYNKYKHINNSCDVTLKNMMENYLSNKVLSSTSLDLTWKIIKNFKPNKFYVKLLIKSLLPISLKRKHLLRSIKKRNPVKPAL